IGRHVAALVRDELGVAPRASFIAALPEPPAGARDDGEVICLCRSITRGQIIAALRGAVPPATLDGVKRRTGAMLGECQGNLCLPLLMDLFVEHRGSVLDPATLSEQAYASQPIMGRGTAQAQ